ncbi:MAG: hypothetical protein IAE94_13935 [Chthoniobacterales bacterium]|nr:hypothetical protein [Chthoniobacterales bacterium]
MLSFAKPLGFPGEAPGFRACFPAFSWLIFRPQITGCLALALALVSVRSEPLFACGFLCLWTGLLSFFLERRVLDRLLLPPFTAVMSWAALGTGLGIPLMYASPYFQEFYEVYRVDNWRAVLFATQCAHLLAFPFAWLGYWSLGFRWVGSLRGEESVWSLSEGTRRKVTLLGWLLLVVAVSLLSAKALMGFEDRSVLARTLGAEGTTSAAFLLNVLPKFSMMGFVFVPFLWQTGTRMGKGCVGGLLLVYVGFALSSGSRGLFLYMAVFVFVGAYLFRRRDVRSFEWGLVGLGVAGSLLIGLLLAYRTSQGFHETTSKNVMSRFRILADPQTYRESFVLRPEGVYRFGYSLFTFDDHLVFAQTPERVPFAGMAGTSAVLWTWIPTTFLPGKVPLLDAESITGAYENPPVKKKVGTGISLSADAYRRFGWWGVPPVAFLAYALYGLLARWCLTSWRSGSVLGWALLALVVTYFWSRPFGTVLSTWWSFFYDAPKHLITLTVLAALVSVLVKGHGDARKANHPSVDKSVPS